MPGANSIRVGGARIDFTADDGGYQRTVSRVLRRQGQLRRDHQRTAAAVRTSEAANRALVASVARLGTIAGAGILLSVGRSAVESAARISDLSDAYGVGIETLQEYRYAAQQAGIAQRTFDTALQRATRRIGEAAQGQGELLKTVAELGIQLRDNEGNLRSTEDVLDDFADHLAQTSDQGDRLRIAFKLFDAEGARLVTLFQRGSRGVRELREEARATGQVLSEDLVRGAKSLSDEIIVLEGRIRTGFQTGILTVTNNLDLLGVAAAAVGGVFAGRYAGGVAVAIDRSRALGRQERITLEVLENAAARRAQIATQEASAAAATTPRAGVARLAQVEAQIAAQRRAAEATRVHAAAQRNLARATTLAGRASRAAAGAINFLGGPVGALVTGLSVATAAWVAFADRSESAAASAVENARRLIDDARNSASGLTEIGDVAEQVLDRIIELEAQRNTFQSRFDPSATLQEGMDLVEPRIRAINAELSLLNELFEELTEILENEDASTNLARISAENRRVSLSLTDATRGARDLARSIADGAREAEIAASEQIALLGVSDAAAERQMRRLAAVARVRGETLRVTRALADAQADSSRAAALVEEQRALAESLALGTKARVAEEQRLKIAQRQAITAAERVAALRIELSSLQQIRIDREAIAAAVRREREARVAAAVVPVEADLTLDVAGARLEAEAFTAQLERGIESSRRALEAQRRILAAPFEARAGLDASLQVLGQFEETLAAAHAAAARAAREDELAHRALADAVRILDAAGASASDEEIERAETYRDTARATAEARNEAELYVLALAGQRQAAMAAAGAAGEVADAQAVLAERTKGLEVVTSIAQAGFRGLEDTLVSVATGGRATFKDFANGIIADMVRILTRTVITQNALAGARPRARRRGCGRLTAGRHRGIPGQFRGCRRRGRDPGHVVIRVPARRDRRGRASRCAPPRGRARRRGGSAGYEPAPRGESWRPRQGQGRTDQ